MMASVEVAPEFCERLRGDAVKRWFDNRRETEVQGCSVICIQHVQRAAGGDKPTRREEVEEIGSCPAAADNMYPPRMLMCCWSLVHRQDVGLPGERMVPDEGIDSEDCPDGLRGQDVFRRPYGIDPPVFQHDQAVTVVGSQVQVMEDAGHRDPVGKTPDLKQRETDHYEYSIFSQKSPFMPISSRRPRIVMIS